MESFKFREAVKWGLKMFAYFILYFCGEYIRVSRTCKIHSYYLGKVLRHTVYTPRHSQDRFFHR